MNTITQNEALKYIRKTAKENGLTFKRTNTKLNGVYLWKFVDRESGNDIIVNCQFWTAYSDCMSGYIETFK